MSEEEITQYMNNIDFENSEGVYCLIEYLLKELYNNNKIIDELKEWLKTKINHCEVLFDDEEYSWNEDFIASLIDRRTTFHMVEDKIKELEEKHE